MEKLFICYADYQGGNFGVGRIQTIREWAETSCEWGDSDGNSICYPVSEDKIEEYKNKNGFDGCSYFWDKQGNPLLTEEVIDYIAEWWQIGICEYNEKEVEEYTKITRDSVSEEVWQIVAVDYYTIKEENNGKLC